MSDNSTNFNATGGTDGENTAPTKISILTPLAYVFVLVSLFVIFSKYYRRRTVKKIQNTKPFFPQNVQKSMYYELLANEDPKTNEKVLKAALFRWASETVRRTLKLKECEQFFNKMYQTGSIGDDMWKRFTIAQKLEEVEIQIIAKEVESFKQGWTAEFFPLLQPITFNEALKRRVDCIDQLAKAEMENYGFDKSYFEKLKSKKSVVSLKLNSS